MIVRLDATGREGYNSQEWGVVEDGNAFDGASAKDCGTTRPAGMT